jgi:hypothetical protein
MEAASVGRDAWRGRFWRRWVLANAGAELFGLGSVAALGYLLFARRGEAGGAGAAVATAAAFVGLGALEGAVVGLAQRQVLHQRLPALRGWVRATMAGAMAAWALGMLPSTLMSMTAHTAAAPPPAPPFALVLLLAAGLGVLAGPLLAAFQWLSLRRVLAHAWTWLPANGAAWALGMPVIFAATQADEWTSSPAAIVAVVALALAAAGAVVGAVHGWALLHLLPDDPTDGCRA